MVGDVMLFGRTPDEAAAKEQEPSLVKVINVEAGDLSRRL